MRATIAVVAMVLGVGCGGGAAPGDSGGDAPVPGDAAADAPFNPCERGFVGTCPDELPNCGCFEWAPCSCRMDPAATWRFHVLALRETSGSHEAPSGEVRVCVTVAGAEQCTPPSTTLRFDDVLGPVPAAAFEAGVPFVVRAPAGEVCHIRLLARDLESAESRGYPVTGSTGAICEDNGDLIVDWSMMPQ